MSPTKDRPFSALHGIARRCLAAATLMRDRILKPDEAPSHVEELVPALGSGRIAGAVLSLTGFSAIWEQDVTNAYPAQSRH